MNKVDKDIQNIIRDEIISNLKIVLVDEDDYYARKTSYHFELFYGDDIISKSEDITIYD